MRYQVAALLLKVVVRRCTPPNFSFVLTAGRDLQEMHRRQQIVRKEVHDAARAAQVTAQNLEQRLAEGASLLVQLFRFVYLASSVSGFWTL